MTRHPQPRTRRLVTPLLGVFLGALLAAGVASAQNNTTTGTGGDWFDPGIWDSGVPADGDGVLNTRIDAGDTVTVAGGSGTWDQLLDIGQGGGGTATGILMITGGSLVGNVAPAATGAHDIGVSGTRTGILDLQGGQFVINNTTGANRNLNVGSGGGTSASTGIINQSGGVLTLSANTPTYFGTAAGTNTGIGSFSGGQATLSGQVRLGNTATSTGIFAVTGGNVTVGSGPPGNDLIVGFNGNGTLNVESGTLTVLDDVRIGGNGTGNSGTGRATVSGGLFAADAVQVGLSATTSANSLTVSGGLASFNSLNLGQNAGSAGSLTVSGSGRLMTNGNLNVGTAGAGGAVISGGIIDIGDGTGGDELNIGANLGSAGSVTMTGGVLNLAARGGVEVGDNMDIGANGVGLFNVTGGTIELNSTFNGQAGGDDPNNRQIRLGQRADGVGSLHVGGTTLIHANEITVGEGSQTNNQDDSARTARASGVLTVTGGSQVYDGTGGNQTTANGVSIYISQQDDSTGTMNVEGGHVITNGDILVAEQGTVVQHVAGANTRFATVFGASEGFFNQTGGTVDVGNGSGGGDVFILGHRGRGEADFSGGVMNIDQDFILGNLADAVGTDAGGTGFGTGVATIGSSAEVNVGRDFVLGQNYAGGAAQGSTGTLNISGNSMVDVTRHLVVGNLGNGTADIDGDSMVSVGGRLVVAGDPTPAGATTGVASNGILNITGNAVVNVSGNADIGLAGTGVLNVTGTASPTVNIGGNMNIGPNPGSRGRVNLSGSNTVQVDGSIVIGSAVNTDALLTQTSGVLIVDGALVTTFIEDGTGTATGHAFTGGTLTRSTDDTLTVTGDLVITDAATVIATGGTLNDGVPIFGSPDPADPFSYGPGSTLPGIDLSVSEGFAAIDNDGTAGNFQGAGVFDFDNASIIPTPNGMTLQSGILWFALIGDTTGASGGQDLADDSGDSASGFLDDISLVNIANLPANSMRLTEAEFEQMLGPGNTYDSAADGKTYYALINGDGVVGFTPRTGQNLGLAWVVAVVPEPGSALLVLLGFTVLLGRRRSP